jgi:two-component system chemotaxis response regulator CheB
MDHMKVDYILPASEIAAKLTELIQQPRGKKRAKRMWTAETPPPFIPTFFTCPSCGGVLSKTGIPPGIQMRCHVGHHYTLEGLALAQSEAIEAALWTAVRMLKERAEFSERTAERYEQSHRLKSEPMFRERAEEARQQAQLIEDLLYGRHIKNQTKKSLF